MQAELVFLPDVPLIHEVADVRAAYEAKRDPSRPKASFGENDWRRTSYVLGLIDTQGSILEVGTGLGHFTRALAKVAKGRVATIDIREPRAGIEIERYNMSATEMSFADGEFDTVVCMEVLDHIPGEDCLKALAEVRRVARKTLIMTVPYCEPLPLDVRRIRDTFPNATYTLLSKDPINRVPWLLIKETFN